MSEQETAVLVSAEAIYLLDKINLQNLEFWPSRLLGGNSPILFWGKLETTIYIVLKLSMTLQCQDRELLCQFFVQGIRF